MTTSGEPNSDVVLADLIEASVRKALTEHFTAQQSEIDDLKRELRYLRDSMYNVRQASLGFDRF